MIFVFLNHHFWFAYRAPPASCIPCDCSLNLTFRAVWSPQCSSYPRPVMCDVLSPKHLPQRTFFQDFPRQSLLSSVNTLTLPELATRGKQWSDASYIHHGGLLAPSWWVGLLKPLFQSSCWNILNCVGPVQNVHQSISSVAFFCISTRYQPILSSMDESRTTCMRHHNIQLLHISLLEEHTNANTLQTVVLVMAFQYSISIKTIQETSTLISILVIVQYIFARNY